MTVRKAGERGTRRGAALPVLLIVSAFLAARPAPAGAAGEIAGGKVGEEVLLFQEIPSVYGASKYEQKVTEAPSSVSIVTAQEIGKYGYRTLADILRSLRGFFTTHDRNYTYLGVRGFNRPGDYNSRVLLLVDGHRINDFIYDTGFIGKEFILDVDLIDRVEVIRGPSSSLYGSNAFFGVINVITRSGGDFRGAEVSGEAGSFDTFKGRFSYGNRFPGGFEVVLSGTAYDSRGQNLFFPEFDDPATNNGVAEKRDGETYRSFLATASWHDFTLQGAYVDREKSVPTGSFGTAFNDPRNETMDDRYYVNLKYEKVFSPRTSVLARVSYDWYGYWGNYVYEDDTVNPDPPFRYVNRDETENEWWSAEAKLTRRIFDAHKVTVGGEYREIFRQDQKNFDEEPFFFSYLDDRRDTAVWAVYLQDEFAIRDDLILNAGVRRDHYDTFGGTTNPRIALIYTPDGRSAVKLLYGEAFRSPNAYEAYYNDGGQVQKGNPDLQPETIRTYEAVVEKYAGESLRLVAAGYHYRIKDLISQQTDPADGLVVFQNVDSVRAWGLETSVEGKWRRGTEGRASYAYQEAENRETRQALTNSPKHLAKLNLAAPLAGGQLFGGLEVQYGSRRNTLAGNTAGGSTVVNLTLFAPRLAEGLEISASVYNLFDKTFGDPGSAEHVQDVIQQDGRNFRVKFAWKL